MRSTKKTCQSKLNPIVRWPAVYCTLGQRQTTFKPVREKLAIKSRCSCVHTYTWQSKLVIKKLIIENYVCFLSWYFIVFVENFSQKHKYSLRPQQELCESSISLLYFDLSGVASSISGGDIFKYSCPAQLLFLKSNRRDN